MTDKCAGLVRQNERERTVESYWREEGGWRWELISATMPNFVLLKLARVVINPNIEEEDRFGWLSVENKTSTVTSVYCLLTERSNMVIWKGWKML